MPSPNTLKITAHGDCELIITRTFDAPRALVWDCLTTPDLLKRWLYGPDDWTLAECDIDLRVGGKYRYLWRKSNGVEMGMGGVYREIVEPERLVSTEKFDESWYPGEAVGTAVLAEKNEKTTLTTTMRYESKAARDAVLASPMESGLSLGYDRLQQVLDSLQS
jgi:uncharacterized protein YndB with AHSA1/START domain